MFTIQDGILLVGLILYVLFQVMWTSIPGLIKYYRATYLRMSWTRIPWYWYLVIYAIVYGALVADMYMFLREVPSDNWNYAPVFALFLFAVFLDKLWMIFYVDVKQMQAASVCAFVVLMSAIAASVMAWMSSFVYGVLYLPFLLLYVHTLQFSVDWVTIDQTVPL
jgi:hypothetical protein